MENGLLKSFEMRPGLNVMIFERRSLVENTDLLLRALGTYPSH